MSALDPLPSHTVRVHRLDPTLAELHLTFANLPEDVEVRGRLMGPRCPGTSTVEVAYPLQRLAPGVYRVRIPEPVLWSAERPCVYEGPMEFRRKADVIGTRVVSVGLTQGAG
jgi:hypothetical protein